MMKKTLFSIAFALIATLSLPVFAQQTATPQQVTCTKNDCTKDKNAKPAKDGRKGDKRFNRHMDPKERMEMLKSRIFEGIELTDAQKQEIDRRGNECDEKINQIRKESNEKIKAAQNDFDAEVKKILSEEQYQQYLSNKEKALNPEPKFTKKGSKIERRDKSSIKADKIARKAEIKKEIKAEKASK